MSLSTSSSKQPTRLFRLYTRVFGLVLGGLILAVVGFNWILDPFDFKTLQLLQYDRKGLNRPKNRVLWILGELRKIPSDVKESADVIILGDSRGWALTEARVTQKQGHTIYNLSIGGGSFEEIIAIYQEEAGFLDAQRLDKVFVSVPFHRICERSRANRVQEVRALAANPLLYYFHHSIAKYSWLSLVARGQSPPKPPKMTDARTTERVEIARVRSEYLRCAANLERRLRMLDEFVTGLQRRGIKVVLWSPAVSQPIVTAAQEPDVARSYERYKQALRKLAPFHDFFRDQDRYDIYFHFSPGDPFHVQRAANERLLALLLET